MSRIRTAVFVMTLCACGIAFAHQGQAKSMWNEEAAKAARAAVDQGLAAVERMDMEALRSLLTTDVVAYDIDLESRPMRMGSLDEAITYVTALNTEATKMAAKLKFENMKNDCRATSDLAYCLLEYDFVATMADGARMVQPSRTTVVLSKVDGAWKWAHWHTSLSELPEAAGAK